MKGNVSDEQIARDRQRLIARDPFAILINTFLNDMPDETLEVVYGEPGLTLDNGVRFIKSEGVNAEKMYSRIYTIADRGHWLKRDIWMQKRGNVVTLYKYDPKGRDGRVS